MRDAYKRRPNDFKRRILARVRTTRADLYLEEERWLKMIKPEEIKKRYYNLALGSTTHWSATDNALSIAEKLRGQKRSEGVCKKFSTVQKKHFEEHPERRAEASARLTKLWEDPEYREKNIAAQNVGKVERWANPDEHEKLSAAQLKRYEASEEREKTGASIRRYYEENPEARKKTGDAVRRYISKWN